ncbi:MAG: kelch repeat-containing protein, partial [Planctomycetota bacterium]
MNRYAKHTTALCAAALALGALGARAGEWVKAGDGHAGHGSGNVLVSVPELKKMLLVGGAVQAFDPAAGKWEQFSADKPKVRRGGIHPYYQAAYDPGTKKIYCLSNGPVLHVFDVGGKKWSAAPGAEELAGLSWHMMAFDPKGKRLVVVGSDKKVDNVGWTRTVLYDLAAGKWKPAPLPAGDVAKKHRELVEATEAVRGLVGTIRLHWYRDPKGMGTEEGRSECDKAALELKGLPGAAGVKEKLDAIIELVKDGELLEALKAARALERAMEDTSFAQYPVPRSRRNAPLACDVKNNACVLFGGDHEDYQMNDTWILDLEKLAWREAKPDVAPSPRAGHALVYLPKSGKVLSYEGYAGSSSRGYGALPWQVLNPREMWVYDAKANRWDLVGSWPIKRGDAATPPPVGGFYGYSASWFNVPALAADAEDRLVLATPKTRRSKSSTWTLKPDLGLLDEAGRGKLGKPPGERRYRTGIFRAEYWERPDDPGARDLAALPANKWTPTSPKLRLGGGCRQRDWGTSIWDSDRDQVLLWGGGHCVRSSSAVVHYSPVSGRMVESYDPEEPYCYNGFCGPGSSLLNRLWVNCHAYNLYAYDPKCELLVTAFGFLYDPGRMDWVRRERVVPPFRYSWGHVVVETTPHGAL